MIGLIIAIITFNLFSFKLNKRFSSSQIAHIWCFTIAFQTTFDLIVDLKYHGYWYFTQAVDWEGLPARLALVPPVNVLFLHYYPMDGTFLKKSLYILIWEFFLLVYESLTMLPAPWGYFHYGWWNLGISAILNIVLLLLLILYYKKFIMNSNRATF